MLGLFVDVVVAPQTFGRGAEQRRIASPAARLYQRCRVLRGDMLCNFKTEAEVKAAVELLRLPEVVLKREDIRGAKPDSRFTAIATGSNDTSASCRVQVDDISTANVENGCRTKHLANRVNHGRGRRSFMLVDGVTIEPVGINAVGRNPKTLRLEEPRCSNKNGS